MLTSLDLAFADDQSIHCLNSRADDRTHETIAPKWMLYGPFPNTRLTRHFSPAAISPAAPRLPCAGRRHADYRRSGLAGYRGQQDADLVGLPIGEQSSGQHQPHFRILWRLITLGVYCA